MDIAQSKRKENIAEYILYLWQLEDLLRALQFSPEAVYATIVKPRGLPREREKELLEWYMDLADILRREGKERVGHSQHTLHLIEDMQELHDKLMVLPYGEQYRTLFGRLSKELPKLRAIIGDQAVGDIELCFRALYAAMLYRMKGDSAALQTVADVLETVSPVISELTRIYMLYERGEVDIYAGLEDNATGNLA
jgi:hypothetical protein